MAAADMLMFGVMWYAVFLFSLTCHEAAHALAAKWLGDLTAFEGGQVTLNPWPHMQREPAGTIVIPVLSFLLTQGQWMMGWASAPYNPAWAERYPKRAAVMAAAGPIANLLLVLLAGLVLRVGLEVGYLAPNADATLFQLVQAVDPESLWAPLAQLLSIGFTLNLVLMTFNLLPLPPLDGAGMLALVIGDDLAQRYNDFIRMPPWPIVGLIAAWNLFPYVFGPVANIAVVLLFW